MQFKITFPTTRTLLDSFLQPLVYKSSEHTAAALNLISRFSESRPTLPRHTPALLPLTRVHGARPCALGACLGVSNTVAILRGGRAYSGTNEDIVVLRAGRATWRSAHLNSVPAAQAWHVELEGLVNKDTIKGVAGL